jgi:hypothetical protein
MALGPVGHQQALIAQNLRGGLASLGDRPLEEAQFGLNKMQLEHTIGRQRAADERQARLDAQMAPVREVQTMAAKNQLAELNQDLTIGMLFPDINTAEQMLWLRRDRAHRKGAGGSMGPLGTPGAAGMDSKYVDYDSPLVERFASMYGAKWDTDPNSPTFTKMVRPDGSTIKKLHTVRDSEPIKAFMMANSGQKHKIQSAKEKLLRSKQKGEIGEKEYSAKLAEIIRIENSPELRIQDLDREIEFISRFVNPKNPAMYHADLSQGLERKQKAREKLTKKLAEDQKGELEHKRKKEIEKLKKEPEYGDKVEYQVGDNKITEVYRGGGKWVKTEGPMWKDSDGDGSEKVPPKIKQAQDLFKNLTKEVSDSAGAILARAMAGDRLTPDDMKTIKDEKVDERKQGLLDSVIGILEEYYGVEKKPETPPTDPITHDYIPGQGLVR